MDGVCVTFVILDDPKMVMCQGGISGGDASFFCVGELAEVDATAEYPYSAPTKIGSLGVRAAEKKQHWPDEFQLGQECLHQQGAECL